MLVTLYVTRDCNMDCLYCYAGAKRPQQMSQQTAEKSVMLTLENSKIFPSIRFFGGEPLLKWALVKHVVDFTLTEAKKRRLLPSFSIATNGILLEEEHLCFFEKHNVGVGISIDGLPVVHDRNRRTMEGGPSFDLVIKKFKLFRDRDIRYSIELVADPTTICDLASSVRFLVKELGVPFIIISVNVFAEWPTNYRCILKEQFEAIGEFYLERFNQGEPFEIDAINNKINVILRGGYNMDRVCKLGSNEVVVVPDGRIYSCLRLVGWDEEGETTIGHVDHGLDRKKIAQQFTQSRIKPSRCKGCENDGICINWCGSTNLVLTGSFSETGDFLCNYEKTLIATCRDIMERLDMEKYRQMNSSYLEICGSCACKGVSRETNVNSNFK